MKNQEILNITWTTKKGEVIRLKDMSENHLKNATLMMRRNQERIDDEVTSGWSCLGMLRGEMAQYHAESEVTNTMNSAEENRALLMLLEKACEIRDIDIDNIKGKMKDYERKLINENRIDAQTEG